MTRVQLPESKLKVRKRKRRVIVTALWGVLVLVLVGGLAALTHLPHYRIVEVEVVGVEGTEAQAVEKVVKEHLNGSYLFLFPHNNVALYSRRSIAADLLTQYPIFARVEIEAHTLRTLTVTIAKRLPKAVWCGEALTAKISCLLLDEEGVAYEPAAQFAGPVYTTFYGPLKEGALPRQYLSEDSFRSLVALAVALEEHQKTRIATVAVDKAQDVNLYFTNGFKLMFALRDGGGDVYERFVLAMEAQPFKNRTTADFEYLDLRFGDRLYYKLKGE